MKHPSPERRTPFLQILAEYFSSNQAAIIHTVVMFIVGAVVTTLFKELLKDWLQSSTWVLLVIMTCVALISLAVVTLVGVVDDVRQRVGTTARYFDEDYGDGRAYLFEQTRKVIESAERSIVIVNSYIPETSANDDDVTTKVRDDYFRCILDCVRQKEKLTYERVLQLEEGQSVSALIQRDDGYVEHFHEILDAIETNPNLKSRVGLIKVHAERVSTFALVDDTKLILQINQPQTNGTVRMQGLFIFEDPRGEISKYFRGFLESAKRHPLGEVQRGELPTRESARKSD